MVDEGRGVAVVDGRGVGDNDGGVDDLNAIVVTSPAQEETGNAEATHQDDDKYEDD